MGKKATSLSFVLCVILLTWADRSLPQARGPQTLAQRRQRLQEQRQEAEQQRRQEEAKYKAVQTQMRTIYDEYSDEAWQEALGATAAQWQAIKPRLEKVRKAGGWPVISLSTYGFGGGGDSSSSSFSGGSGGAGGSGPGGAVSGGPGGSTGAASGGSTAGSSGWVAGASAPGGVTIGGRGSVRGPSHGGASFGYSGSTSGGAAGGVSGGASGGFGSRGEAFSGAASSGSGYGFAFGGPRGAVKKQVDQLSLGWQWSRPSLRNSPGPLTENEKICEQLLDALEAKDPDPEEVRRRVQALREARRQIEAGRQEARRQLREVVTPQQEAKLILMGYLD